MSRGHPEDVPERRLNILRTSSYGPICNAKRRLGTHPQRDTFGSTEDINLS